MLLLLTRVVGLPVLLRLQKRLMTMTTTLVLSNVCISTTQNCFFLPEKISHAVFIEKQRHKSMLLPEKKKELNRFSFTVEAERRLFLSKWISCLTRSTFLLIGVKWMGRVEAWWHIGDTDMPRNRPKLSFLTAKSHVSSIWQNWHMVTRFNPFYPIQGHLLFLGPLRRLLLFFQECQMSSLFDED